MEICVLTLGDKNIQDYSRYAFNINRSYCEQHGYTYIQYNDILDHSRPAAWSKILAIKNHINDCDWIMWIDADAIFFNHDIKIEERIDQDYNLILGKGCGDDWLDKNQHDYVNVNTGVFLIKGKNSWSSFLLDEIYAKTEFINQKWWENYALMKIISSENNAINSKIKVLDQNLINGYENRMYGYFNFTQDQFIMHYAGITLEERIYALRLRYEEFLDGKFSGEKKYERRTLT